MKREWKDIVGYCGNYQVSNCGEVLRIKSLDSRGHMRKTKVLKQHTTSDGYKQLGLYKDGKETKFLVHRLVADAFLEKRDLEIEVNHKDENKKNNEIENLEWCTHKYNSNYGTLQKRRIATRKSNKLTSLKSRKGVFNHA